MKLAAKQVDLGDCPYVTDESKTELAASAAPPIRLIELVGRGRQVKAGNETVLFRHEKTFVNRPGVLIDVADTLEEAAIEEQVKRADAYTVDYVGVELGIDGFAVGSTSGDPARFAGAVGTVRRVSDLPMVLVGEDPDVLEPAWRSSMGRSRSSSVRTSRTGSGWPIWRSSMALP